MKNKKVLLLIIIVIILILADQITKICIMDNIYYKSINIIPKILDFTYVENTGGAYGIRKW